MTVVPADHLMKLICDGCGDTIIGTTTVLPDAEVVWTLVIDNGWTGSPFASGPHHCSRCSLGSPTRQRRGDDAGLNGGTNRTTSTGGNSETRDAHTGDLDAGDALRTALRKATDLGDRVLVDLSDVTVLEPNGIGLLVRARQKARQRGATLYLVAPSRLIRVALHTMRLDGAFPVVENQATAPPRSSVTARTEHLRLKEDPR
jgi:anti-sigma B factor antagonist